MILRKLYLLLAITTLLCQACSLTKGLPPDTKVVKSVTISLNLSDKKGTTSALKSDLNSKILFDPVAGLAKSQVYIYNNVNKKEKKKGLANWIKKTIGKAPEIYNARKLETSRGRMEKYLIDQGHFSSRVKADTILKDQLVQVIFDVYSSGRYEIDSVAGLADTMFQNLTTRQKAFVDLKKAKYYDKNRLDFLRSESVNNLRRQGYFNVDQNQFYFYLDTVPGNKKVDIYFEFTDPSATGEKIFRYRNINYYPNYSLGNSYENKSLEFSENHINVYADSSIIKPKLFSRISKKDSARLFNPRSDFELISRLRATNVFKFVNLTYDTLSINDNNFIDRRIQLTPRLMRDVGFEFQVNTTNGSALGSEISTTYQHLNLFKGAEKLHLKASVGGELQSSASTQKGIFNTYDIVLSSSLTMPGLLGFGKDRYLSKGPTIPFTAFGISNQFQSRNNYYTINSSDFVYTYKIGTSKENHQLSPISVDYVKVLKKTTALDSVIALNPRLSESLTDVFIFSANYIYYHATPTPSTKRGGYYYSFQGGIESAGGLLSLIKSSNSSKVKTILGVPFSQYIKGDIDYLPKYAFGKHILAGRISLGLGLPYGNSNVLPYIKQYFVGGASSLRAFDIRTLGPGGYVTQNTNTGTNFLDQTGDVKIELNLEYRFPLFSYLKGALFIDAGNVWLAKKSSTGINEDLGIFDFQDFYKEMGVGVGAGLRIDFDITVLRFDLATPIYDPRKKLGWTTKNWSENLKLRIGIGYPF